MIVILRQKGAFFAVTGVTGPGHCHFDSASMLHMSHHISISTDQLLFICFYFYILLPLPFEADRSDLKLLHLTRTRQSRTVVDKILT